MRHFLVLTEKAAGTAQAKFDTMTLEAIEDLEAQETPEGLLLSALRGEESGDRAQKEGATQWLKFQWEAYRSVLEVSKNNAKLEDIYAEAARGAFAFCLKYKRKTEFRRVCDMLRLHLTGLSKANAQHASNLQVPETMQQHLETRFSQLKTACDLELWQEAFRSAEDLHNLIGHSKRPPKGQMMMMFYTKYFFLFLACLFFMLLTQGWLKFFGFLRTTCSTLVPCTSCLVLREFHETTFPRSNRFCLIFLFRAFCVLSPSV